MFNNAQIKLQSQILVGVQFFFSAAVVGLTNRPSVRLSNAGAPLTSAKYHSLSCDIYSHVLNPGIQNLSIMVPPPCHP